jgi:hypothetical protein
MYGGFAGLFGSWAGWGWKPGWYPGPDANPGCPKALGCCGINPPPKPTFVGSKPPWYPGAKFMKFLLLIKHAKFFTHLLHNFLVEDKLDFVLDIQDFEVDIQDTDLLEDKVEWLVHQDIDYDRLLDLKEKVNTAHETFDNNKCILNNIRSLAMISHHFQVPSSII